MGKDHVKEARTRHRQAVPIDPGTDNILIVFIFSGRISWAQHRYGI